MHRPGVFTYSGRNDRQRDVEDDFDAVIAVGLCTEFSVLDFCECGRMHLECNPCSLASFKEDSHAALDYGSDMNATEVKPIRLRFSSDRLRQRQRRGININ